MHHQLTPSLFSFKEPFFFAVIWHGFFQKHLPEVLFLSHAIKIFTGISLSTMCFEKHETKLKSDPALLCCVKLDPCHVSRTGSQIALTRSPEAIRPAGAPSPSSVCSLFFYPAHIVHGAPNCEGRSSFCLHDGLKAREYQQPHYKIKRTNSLLRIFCFVDAGNRVFPHSSQNLQWFKISWGRGVLKKNLYMDGKKRRMANCQRERISVDRCGLSRGDVLVLLSRSILAGSWRRQPRLQRNLQPPAALTHVSSD